MEAAAALRRAVALWYVDQGPAADIVYAACDLLVNNVDGPWLRELAAVEIGRAEVEVDPLLAQVLIELGLPHPVRESTANEEAALSAMAYRVVSEKLSPRELTRWAHLRYGHDTLELAEHLAFLDDRYDLREYAGEATDDVDADVVTEARRIVSLTA